MGEPLGAFGDLLRRTCYSGSVSHPDPRVAALHAFAAGDAVPAEYMQESLGNALFESLQGEAWVVAEPGSDRVRGAYAIFPVGAIMTAVPYPRDDGDHVHVGPDSLALFRHVWPLARHGRRAVELGTGNGFIAAAFALRFRSVVATDISPLCVSVASLVPRLNPPLAARFDAVVADVGDGLRDGAFDLVLANPPWVPEPLPAGEAPRRFAAGGPTGFELPRRFLDAAARLLAPGGRGFVTCLDVALANGTRPLRDHARALESDGCEVRITPTGHELRSLSAARRVDHAVAAEHVVVELHKV